MERIDKLIKEQEDKLLGNVTKSEVIGIKFNLIKLKNEAGRKGDNYRDIKKFIDYYIDYVKEANYGYDSFNFQKLDDLMKFLTPEEQVNIMQYAVSVSARELPEHDREGFVKRKHQAEIKRILKKGETILYPKALFLFCGQNINRLFFSLLIFFILVNVLLLPAISKNSSLFEIQYNNYSCNFYLNHILNVATFFADLDTDFELIPKGWLGVLFLIFGKIFFAVLVVNFVYIKISDKISLK